MEHRPALMCNFFAYPHSDETKELNSNLGDTSVKIILAIKNDNEISITQLASQLAISTTAVDNQLAKLKKKGILLRHGTKGGYWESVRKLRILGSNERKY